MEARLAEMRATLEQFTGKVDTILTAFEPGGSSLAEDLRACLEAVQGQLEGFVKKVTEDAV